jgi:hypothetical protein
MTTFGHRILAIPPQDSIKGLFRKQRKGQYSVMFHRGTDFDRTGAAARQIVDSPNYELLQTIGFEPPAIAHMFRTYQARLIGEWADITLAARERHGENFFKKSAMAYFLDNIRHAAAGKRTPPDWWRELRRQEQQQTRTAAADDPEAALDRYLETEAREAFEQVTQQIFADLVTAGKH